MERVVGCEGATQAQGSVSFPIFSCLNVKYSPFSCCFLIAIRLLCDFEATKLPMEMSLNTVHVHVGGSRKLACTVYYVPSVGRQISDVL